MTQWLQPFCLCLLCSAFAISAISANAEGNTNPEKITTDDSLTSAELFDLPLHKLLKLKITSSTLTDEPQKTVPASVTVFTREEIQQMPVNTIADLLAYVPGFQVFRQGDASNDYYHSARGRRTGTSSREVLVLIDGQRFSRESTNSVATQMIPLGNIEKVEIIRGPASSIYGSNAFLGLINITTIKNQNGVQLNYGSNKNTQGQILASKKFGELAVDVYANAFNDEGESYHLENSFSPGSFYHSRDPNQGQDINIKLGKNNSHLNIMHFNRRASEFYLGELSSNEYNRTRSEYTSIQFEQKLDVVDAIDTVYRINYSNADNFRQTALLPPKVNVDFEEHNYGFNLHNNWTVNPGHSLQFGLEQRHIEAERVNINTAAGKILYIPAVNRDVNGLYIQSLNKLSKDIGLTLGARYDSYSQIESSFNPRFGLTHQLSDTQTIKLLYGEAFRAPTIGELNFASTGGIEGNPDLKPETVASWELVWIATWQQQSLTITGFHNKIEDSIIQGVSGLNRTYINSSDTEESQGVEIEFISQLTSEWELRAQYSYFDNLSDSSFRQTDKLGSAILNYHHNQWNWNLGASYNSERKMTVNPQGDQIDLSGYWLLHSKLQYDLTPTQTIYLQAKNLLDKDYLTPTQGTTLTQGLPNRGREVSIGLKWMFN